MDLCRARPVVRRLGCRLLGLLVLTGCSGRAAPPDYADVSGKVLIEGKPLPGGQVSFVSVNGGFAASGSVDEGGGYQLKAPVGEVIITVNNSMLQPRKGAPGKGAPGKGPLGKGGGSAPKELPHPKQAGAEEQAAKGHWVNIPSRYTAADSSDLKYTVKPGAQVHDIELSAAPAPPPGANGQ